MLRVTSKQFKFLQPTASASALAVVSSSSSLLFSSLNNRNNSRDSTMLKFNSSTSAALATNNNFTSLRFASTSDNFEGKGGSVEANDETHPDFAPKPIQSDDTTEEREQIMQDIRETIRDEPVVIFIKGLPECPVCSFSKKLVDILDALQIEYTSFDVLAHPVVRTYVKEVSQWQTIPQLFVKGEFIGGVDVVSEMAREGHLQILFEKREIPFKPYQF